MTIQSKYAKILLAMIVAATSLTTALTKGIASSAVIWSELFVDSDADYGVGYYSDIDKVFVGSVDNDSNNIVALIDTYYAPSTSFFITGYGSLAFDTNNDGIDDFVAYAPSASLSYYTEQTRVIVNGQGTSTGCVSSWSMSSDYLNYAVVIPWRCLGAPSQTRIEAWLSNSVGYDFLDYGRTVYPLLPSPPTTAPPTTLPPATVPVTTVPPAVVQVPQVPQTTLPLAAAANTSTPGLVDDWIEYLVVKQPVSLTAVINSTNCCYGVKTGTRTMTVLSKSRGSCVVRGKRLYPVKTGTCYVKVTVGSKKKKTETVTLRVRKA